MPIRTCLFDLGNVLVLFSHEQMCQQVADLIGRPVDAVRDVLLDGELATGFDCGRWPPEDFHRMVMERLGTRCGVDEFNHALSAIFTLNGPMPPILHALRDAGLRLVLLSNTCWPHITYIRSRFELLDCFDECVLSCAVGAAKPDPVIFTAAKNAIQCPPSECFFTDDIAVNVDAARQCGFDAEVFRGADGLRGHLADRGIRLSV